MKNEQKNEFGKSAENLLSAKTTTAAAAPTTTTAATTTTIQSVPPVPPISLSSSSSLLSSPLGNFTENVENANKNNNNDNNNATAAQKAAHATKMTDEHNCNEKNDTNTSSSSIVNNNNGNLIAEAAKILLKNGLNGTSAAAAAFLTAATTFQLPTLPPLSTTNTLAATASTSIPPTPIHQSRSSAIDCVGNKLEPPPAHVASCSKVTTNMSSAVAVAGHLTQRNNTGISQISSASPNQYKSSSSSAKDMCLTVVPPTSSGGGGFLGKSVPNSKVDTTGVIDYTLGTATNGTQKVSSCFPGGGGGGRLQFFKDGKFILELARSKDGERGGWVSVPRKNFRQPSTTTTVTPASTANAGVYPKMESSTSLSFSDDNSSIQSSPWQRDHSWKQTTPKLNISKEMALYYRAPKNVIMTKAGIQIAKRKRRRPYDESAFKLQETFKLFESTKGQNRNMNSSSTSDQSKCLSNCDSHNGNNNNNSTIHKSEEEDFCSTSSSISTLVGDNDSREEAEHKDTSDTSPCPGPTGEKSQQLPAAAKSINETKSDECEDSSALKENYDEKSAVNDGKNDTVEKMNTSEDDGDEIISPKSPKESLKSKVVDNSSSNEIVKKEKLKSVDITENAKVANVQSNTGVEDKRLNKRKVERAKLTSIVQKLIDRMPARISNLAKVPIIPNSSNFSNNQLNTNFQSNKVSPTSSSSSSTSPSLISTTTSSVSATASRLVDYHHHQQHVSPRKRILREFEKVSLEDTAVTGGAVGGKRSRAKNNASSSATNANCRNARSPNNRVQSNVLCAIPSIGGGSLSSPLTSTGNGESSQNGSYNSSNSSNPSRNSTNANVPTRLYSSYSIHSLLGDQGDNNKAAKPANTEQQSTSTSNNIGFHQPTNTSQAPSTEHSFINTRKSVSPKSPETGGGGGGGKSPSSSNSANKKRSPPYASPMHDSLSRSPSVSNSVDYSQRATPPEYKQRYGALSSLSEQQQNMLSSGSSSNSHHPHQQNHRHLQQGAFYSPYLMSAKYSSGSGGSLATGGGGGATSPSRTARSPRNAAAASPTTSSQTLPSANTQNIPNSSYSSHIAPPPPSHLQREMSPSRSMAEFSRESTPRTVPKKTASIRRQFASPTATSSHNSTTNNSTNCPSPSERHNEEGLLLDGSKPPGSASASVAAYQQLLQRTSPSSALSSPLHAAAYYMYPPANPLASASGPSHTQLAHAASTSAYIPSYYHSYLSALNITKHYYMGAGASQSAAARLSSPFHPMSIPYNGVSAAAVAAAAAAAAATAAFSGQHHMGHHQMLPPPSAAALYGGGGFNMGGGLNSGPTSTACSTVQQTHKLTDSNLTTAMNANITGGDTTISTGTTMTASSRSAQQYSSNKDEHSSDVPLNLSKH